MVAHGVVDVKWKQDRHKIEDTKQSDISRAHKNPQLKIALWKTIQHKYEPPAILRFIISTDSCLESDNGVSTSNSPPARNIVLIYPDYYVETCIPKYQILELFFTQI